MNHRTTAIAIEGATALLALLVLAAWLGGGRDEDVQVRAAPEAPTHQPAVMLPEVRGNLTVLDGTPSDLPGLWPGFRGPRGDNIRPEGPPLLREWPAQGPLVVWSIPVGEGHAGAAVRDGRVYLLDYDHGGQADVQRCLSLADGRDIWQYSYGVEVKRNHGMSRTVPAVTEDVVVSLGPKCHVTCLDAKTGELRWSVDLVREYGTKVPAWYAGQCPLIEGDSVIIAPAGPEVLMTALRLSDGEELWRAPNPRGWQMTHSSVVPAEVGGRRMYIYCGSGGVAGVSADDGAIFWDTTAWRINVATVPTPLVVGEGRVLLTGGYNAGSMLLGLAPKDEGFEAETVFRLKPKVFGSDQQTPILYDGHIYGVIPSGELACLSLDGEQVWSSGNTSRFGLGPYLIADGKILVLGDKGTLMMVEATPDGYRHLAQAKVLPGHDAWAPMAMAEGLLIVRDLNTMTCLDLTGSAQ